MNPASFRLRRPRLAGTPGTAVRLVALTVALLAAKARAGSCTSQPTVCGDACQVTCEAARCSLETGVGSTADCRSVSCCDAQVGAGSTVLCNASASCDVTCLGDCTVNCSASARCAVACGETCEVRCSGSGECFPDCAASGGYEDCGDGRRGCGLGCQWYPLPAGSLPPDTGSSDAPGQVAESERLRLGCGCGASEAGASLVGALAGLCLRRRRYRGP